MTRATALATFVAMGFYDKYIVPRIVDAGGGMKEVAVDRVKCLAEVKGSVLEVGFGTGHNLPHYPSGVEKVVGVDPSGQSALLAKKRIAAAAFPVELIEQPAEELAAADSSFDSVVSTYSLCTIGDPSAALVHMLRVLKPGGRFFFLEHGRADEPNVQRWQNRMNGIQNWLFAGCNINRQIDDLITSAGFAIETLDRYYAKTGPKPLSFVYRGIARRAP